MVAHSWLRIFAILVVALPLPAAANVNHGATNVHPFVTPVPGLHTLVCHGPISVKVIPSDGNWVGLMFVRSPNPASQGVPSGQCAYEGEVFPPSTLQCAGQTANDVTVTVNDSATIVQSGIAWYVSDIWHVAKTYRFAVHEVPNGCLAIDKVL